MATIVKNYNSIIADVLHRPITKNERYVLYPRLSLYTGEIEGNTKAEQDSEFIKRSQNSYNSPTNIRRVFITHSGVVVQYYVGYTVNSNTVDTIQRRKYENENIIETIYHMVNWNAEQQEYVRRKTIDKTAKAPDRYNLKGNVLGVFSHPYTCSNIEEIYIDWTILASEDTRAYFNEFGSIDAINSFMNGSIPSGINKNKNLESLFCSACLGNAKNIRYRFPRLRMIAMVHNLADIIANSKITSNMTAKIEASKNTWLQDNIEILKSSGSFVMYSELNDIKFPNDTFTLKDNQYKFDAYRLKPWYESYKKKLLDFNRSKIYGSNTDTEDLDTNTLISSEAEKILIDISQKYGEQTAKNVFLISAKVSGAVEVKKQLMEFSKPNREKYANMINLKF